MLPPPPVFEEQPQIQKAPSSPFFPKSRPTVGGKKLPLVPPPDMHIDHESSKGDPEPKNDPIQEKAPPKKRSKKTKPEKEPVTTESLMKALKRKSITTTDTPSKPAKPTKKAKKIEDVTPIKTPPVVDLCSDVIIKPEPTDDQLQIRAYKAQIKQLEKQQKMNADPTLNAIAEHVASYNPERFKRTSRKSLTNVVKIQTCEIIYKNILKFVKKLEAFKSVTEWEEEEKLETIAKILVQKEKK